MYKYSTENKNTRINTVFRVKKCLFNSPLKDCKSPKITTPEQKMHLQSPGVMMSVDESPYSMYLKPEQNQKYIETPTRPLEPSTPLRSNQSLKCRDICDYFSVLPSPNNPIKIAVQKSTQQSNLIGDFSKSCALPTIVGKHSDLSTISPETLAMLLIDGENSFPNFTLVDCRYPYEFNGGHIKAAQNIYVTGYAKEYFFSGQRKIGQTILIFYCEFSSERAPNMIRHLRAIDREINHANYPKLHYPEIYLMEGGYKAFYETYKELCIPQSYQTMKDDKFSTEFSFYRRYSKTINSRKGNRRTAEMDCS